MSCFINCYIETVVRLLQLCDEHYCSNGVFINCSIFYSIAAKHSIPVERMCWVISHPHTSDLILAPSGSREGTAEQYHRGSPGPSTQACSACQQPDTLPDSGHANRHKHSADKPKGSRVRPGPHAAVVLVVLIGDGGVSPPWVLWRACICTATPQLPPPSLESQLRLAHASP
jgi:hypothetical protein